MTQENLRLMDLGERQILQQVILSQLTPSSSAYIPIGDDCAVIQLPNSEKLLAITTDPCPLPIAWLLGYKDYYYYGWFSLAINVSDLASMGATPVGIVLSVEAENEMLVSDLERFFQGARDAAKAFNCPILGGNMKESTRFNVVGSAVGTCILDRVLTRSGAQPGDLLVVLGELGSFATGMFAKYYGITLQEDETTWSETNIFRPMVKITEGQLISDEQLVSSCMDSSDGLIACFYEIAKQSSVDILVDLSLTKNHPAVDKVAQAVPIDKRKLLMMWGDWQLVCTVSPKKLSRLLEILNPATSVNIIGEVTLGMGSVFLKEGEKQQKLRRIESERFSKQSYFSHGLPAILQDLISVDLYD